jgi:hypothetical protein
LVKITNDVMDSIDSKTDAAASRVTSRQKTIQVGKGFCLSTMNSNEGETQLLSTACTICPLIVDRSPGGGIGACGLDWAGPG